MANEVEVGGIVVRLIADARQLEAALSKGGADLRKFGQSAEQANKQAQKSAEAHAKAITGVVTRITGLVAAFVGVNSVIGAFNNAMANVTALDHLSQVTGVGIERLSELRNVAIATGVDFETVSRAFEQFGARMNEALASSTSKGSQALRALGVDVRDAAGNIRQLDDVLPEMADRFAQFANGSNKAALASALFGEEAGPKMLVLLNKGKAGLEEIRRTVGSTITNDDAERVRQYTAAMAKLRIVFEAIVLALSSFVLPKIPSAGTVQALNDITIATGEQARVVNQLNAMMEEQVKLRGRANANTQQAHEAATRRLNDLRSQLSAEQALAMMRDNGYNNAPPRQAPAMDPFALEKAGIALEQIMERLQGQRDIFDSINTSWEEHERVVQQALNAIDRASDQKFRAEAARHRFLMQQRKEDQAQMLAVASQAAQTITALWPKQKGAAIAAAIINTAVGVTKALSSGAPPWNFAMAALVAASGAAQIAAIRSTGEDGNSAGASVAAAPAAAPEAPMGRAVTINGVDPGSMFSGGQVRGLIDLINDEVKNGATLISSGRLAA